MLFTIAVIAAALVAAAERGRDRSTMTTVSALLDSRWAPLAVGGMWAACMWWSWGSWNPAGITHDELAYLLQAKLFASGRWTAPPPPSDLFAQAHVLIAPRMASKYPPGHSLVLALGTLLGAPALIVVLLGALRAGLTFALARRITDGGVALVTTLFTLHGDSLRFGASYFSETTTGALLLVSWYALLRWREERGMRWVVLLAFALGWCAITRPFSAVLFALPIAFVVLHDVLRQQRWRELGVALAVGTAIVAIIPLWSARTTGDWRLWPVTQYTRDYMPFDHPHFGVDTATPRRTLPPDLAMLVPSLRAVERDHQIARLPEIAAERYVSLARATWVSPVPEALLALLGLVSVPISAMVAVATAVIVFVGYLAHPTWADWTIYNMEIAPVLVFLTVCGLARLFREIARSGHDARGSRALAVVGVLTLMYVQADLRHTRSVNVDDRQYQERFRQALARVPGPAIVFVRHADWHSPHLSLVTNGPDWPTAQVWVVSDGGDARNAALLRAAPQRRPFLYDERRSMIDPYAPAVPASVR